MERELIFKKYDGTIIKNVHDYVKYWVEENPYGTVTIGCDSHEHSRYIKYAVSIIMYAREFLGRERNGDPIYSGHGGHVISADYVDKNKNMKSDIYTKLWAETEVTIEVAKMIGDIGIKPILHLDYNSDEKEYSHVLYNAGIGYARGLGYEAYGKPWAWEASICADKLVKGGRK